LKSKWHQHLKTPEEKKKFRESVFNSKFVLDRLKEICYNIIEEAQKSTVVDYDSPSWSHRQADRIGYVRAIEDIIKLLHIDPEEK